MPRFIVAATLGLLAAAASAAGWDDEQVADHAIGQDRFVAGGSLYVTDAVEGDLLTAGGDVTVTSEVGGDLVIAGGDVRISGPVGHGLYAAGGSVEVDGNVARNVRAAGGSVTIGRAARIAGNATLGGGEVRVTGPIDGYLQAAGGRVYLDGPVGGDVEAAGEQIELGPAARIEGQLRYQSNKELKRAPGAEVRGGIERLEPPRAPRGRFEGIGEGAAVVGAAWSIGLLVAAAIMAGALPGLASRLGETFQRRFGWSLLWGFVALVCIPAAALILLVTIIGLPLALATLAGYFVLLLAGFVAAGVGAGNLALRRWQPARVSSAAWRIGAAVLAMLLIVLLGWLPWIGGLVGFAALLLGMGGLLLQIRRQAG